MDNCNFCGHSDIESIKNFGKHPIAHDLVKAAEEQSDIYTMHLVYCKRCDLIQLDQPIEPHKFYSNYFTVSSWKPQPHIPQLIDTLLNRLQLPLDAKVIEVGSNDGIFLKALREHGMHNLMGVEPAKDARELAISAGIHTVGEYFNSETADELVSQFGKQDVFVTRQNLEHINDLVDYGLGMRKVLKDNALVLIEVPYFNGNLAWTDYSIWEEHVNYFTEKTLAHFCDLVGIEVLRKEVTLFAGETLIFYGRYKASSNDMASALENFSCDNSDLPMIQRYTDNVDKFMSDAKSFLLEFKQTTGKKVALYGAGGRATSFINFLGLAEYVDFVLDDQKEKQGFFLPGKNIPIISGAEINDHDIGLVLLGVNTEVEDKVIQKHQEYIARGGIFYSILPPSEILPPFWSKYIER